MRGPVQINHILVSHIDLNIGQLINRGDLQRDGTIPVYRNRDRSLGKLDTFFHRFRLIILLVSAAGRSHSGHNSKNESHTSGTQEHA